jgi:hypothetical protein
MPSLTATHHRETRLLPKKNFAISIPLWILGLADPAAFVFFGLAIPPSLIFFNGMLWFVVAFGIGYFLVSRDITKNHGIVLIGAFAKVVTFIDFTVTVALAEAGSILLVFGSGDLIFAVLFLEFLIWSKNGHLSS